ncbi:MAG TPA: hypothetical protein VGN64_22990 [Dyadobacter sp.]|jgi:hypothetical protein|nr:hypothetical protein [Dyadobacter sp.]
MPNGNTVFKELEPNEEVPAYLKRALVAEVDTIRNSMEVVTLFTEFFLKTVTVAISEGTEE